MIGTIGTSNTGISRISSDSTQVVTSHWKVLPIWQRLQPEVWKSKAIRQRDGVQDGASTSGQDYTRQNKLTTSIKNCLPTYLLIITGVQTVVVVVAPIPICSMPIRHSRLMVTLVVRLAFAKCWYRVTWGIIPLNYFPPSPMHGLQVASAE